jgi:glycosyltransferase involved in cell wall biosynthesis
MNLVLEKKQKVLLLFYEPYLSGISRHVIYLLNAMGDEQYDFWVLCSTGDGKIQQALKNIVEEDRVKIVPPGRFFSFNGVWEALRIIRSQKIDTIHIHNLQSAPWAYAAVVFSGLRRVIFTPHVVGIETKLSKLLSQHLWKLLRPFTMTFIAVSKSQHDLMLRWRIAEHGRVKFVANHVDKSELRDKYKQKRQAIRKENGIAEAAVVVSQMARLDRQKNPFFLINVAKLIQEQAPEMVFILIGEGPLRKSLEQEIKRHNLNDRVRLKGYRHDGLNLLLASDIVTLTSRWEGLPYVLLEAIYFRKPVIATDIPGIRDLVANGKSGYLAKTEEKFAARLVQLAQSKELRDQMGKEGYRRNESLFDICNMAGLMREIYGK